MHVPQIFSCLLYEGSQSVGTPPLAMLESYSNERMKGKESISVNFLKMHGTLNDFVLIDGRGLDLNPSHLAKEMCDRTGGIGSDGLILIHDSSSADLRMQMFNPDGSEAEMCGNGIRCFTKYGVENGLLSREGPLDIETKAGTMIVWPICENDQVTHVRVDMGIPRLNANDIPMLLSPTDTTADGPIIDYSIEVSGIKLEVTCVSMGNPHAIAFLDSPVDDFPLERIGPLVETHQAFPEKVNFSIVNHLNRTQLRSRVWERGAGMTMACGTGASAQAVAARMKGLVDDDIQVDLPGGTLEITWDGQSSVFMEGPATEVFQGEWPYQTP